MTTRTAAAGLRLASANRRIAAFLEQIDQLEASSFPHDDGRRVLQKIRTQFDDLRRRLDLPPSAGDELADSTCLDVAWKISEYTDILGLVLRSTNVRNPFELHHALKQLVERLIERPADLLISSEWDFRPFTFPVGIDLLPDVVLIGSPAPESENALIVPLAAHEIGHSVWRVENVEAHLASAVHTVVEEAIRTSRRASSDEDADDLVRMSTISVMSDRCAEHAMHQLEEIYCDMVGLYVFGSSFLYAFDYLLGPGGNDRSLDYPSDARRMEILAKEADRLGIAVDPALTERWTDATVDPKLRVLAPVVDEAVSGQIVRLSDNLALTMERLAVAPPTPAEIDAVYQSFRIGQPYAQRASLGAIVSAGWKLIRAKNDLSSKEDREAYKVLCDLIWKSIEVSEYLEKASMSDA